MCVWEEKPFLPKTEIQISGSKAPKLDSEKERILGDNLLIKINF